MCGIAGYLNLAGRHGPAEAAALVGRMSGALAHRGPDDHGLWADAENRCHLGHRRLSILDLSAAGRQPMATPDGRYVISFNGEIYNFRDLRRQMEKQGRVFRTGTDTEVLLAGFAVLGPKLFDFLDGMFALAIYDCETRMLTLARDRAGEKPLYYASTPAGFAFASELRALLELPELPAALSEAALAQYFTLRYVPAPDSILDGIHKLPPGCLLQLRADGSIETRRYFSFALDRDHEVPAAVIDGYADALEGALAKALSDRLNADVPLGLFLSAGVDSALVAAILTKKLGQRPQTFTIGFDGDAESEHPAAAEIAALLGTEHRQHIFSAADFDRICDGIGPLLDEPNGDRSCMPTYLLSGFARQHVTVAISGDGGDELFGGYSRYPALAAAFARNPDAVPPALVQAAIERGLPVAAPAAVRAAFPDGWMAMQAFYERYAPLFVDSEEAPVHGLRRLDFLTYLPGAVLAKVDRMSMRHGLETRTPFFHPAVLALAGRASASLCIEGPVQKVALRRLLARWLPERLALAPKKGFGMPLSVFFGNKPRVEAELTAAYRRLGETHFFAARPGALDRLFGNIGASLNAVWAAIVLARWIDSVERPL